MVAIGEKLLTIRWNGVTTNEPLTTRNMCLSNALFQNKRLCSTMRTPAVSYYYIIMISDCTVCTAYTGTKKKDKFNPSWPHISLGTIFLPAIHIVLHVLLPMQIKSSVPYRYLNIY